MTKIGGERMTDHIEEVMEILWEVYWEEFDYSQPEWKSEGEAWLKMKAEELCRLIEPKPDKNRLLSNEELDKLAKEYPLLDFSFEDDYREEVRIMREAQRDLTTSIMEAECRAKIEQARKEEREMIK